MHVHTVSYYTYSIRGVWFLIICAAAASPARGWRCRVPVWTVNIHVRTVPFFLFVYVPYFTVSCTVPPGVLYPPMRDLTVYFRWTQGKSRARFRCFSQTPKFATALWWIVVFFLLADVPPQDDPRWRNCWTVSNMPAVAVVFGLGRALWSVWIRSQGNNERPNQGRASYRLLDDIPSQE